MCVCVCVCMSDIALAQNVGNTCYVNSLLQAFFMIPEFRTEIFRQLVDDHVRVPFVCGCAVHARVCVCVN